MKEPLKSFDLDDDWCRDFVKQFDDKTQFVSHFARKFNSIIAYHATRLSDNEQSAITCSGLKLPSIPSLRQKAIDRFTGENDTPELRESIKSEIDSYFKRQECEVDARIYFSIAKEVLCHRSPQYLLFGPETLLCLADELNGKFSKSFRERMSEFGVPYLVKVCVPLADVKRIWIEGIYEFVNHEFPETCLVLDKEIPPESIIAFERIEQSELPPIHKFV